MANCCLTVLDIRLPGLPWDPLSRTTVAGSEQDVTIPTLLSPDSTLLAGLFPAIAGLFLALTKPSSR
jgi:hypothetical protein